MIKLLAGLLLSPLLLTGLIIGAGSEPPGAFTAAACIGPRDACGGPVLPGTPGALGAPWGEGGLTPKTIPVRRAVLAEFGPMRVIGKAGRANKSEHPLGRGLDFMTGGDRAKGDAIAAWAVAHSAQLDILYVIWDQHIWSSDRAAQGWRLMPDRGSVTANHGDHPHISVNP